MEMTFGSIERAICELRDEFPSVEMYEVHKDEPDGSRDFVFTSKCPDNHKFAVRARCQIPTAQEEYAKEILRNYAQSAALKARQYRPSDLSITIDGVSLTGYGDADLVSIQKRSSAKGGD